MSGLSFGGAGMEVAVAPDTFKLAADNESSGHLKRLMSGLPTVNAVYVKNATFDTGGTLLPGQVTCM